jgi:hypothetical protein
MIKTNKSRDERDANTLAFCMRADGREDFVLTVEKKSEEGRFKRVYEIARHSTNLMKSSPSAFGAEVVMRSSTKTTPPNYVIIEPVIEISALKQGYDREGGYQIIPSQVKGDGNGAAILKPIFDENSMTSFRTFSDLLLVISGEGIMIKRSEEVQWQMPFMSIDKELKAQRRR